MPALNHSLEKQIVAADGRYLTPEELRSLENYVNSYAQRLETYQKISQHSDAMVLNALKKFARVHPEIIQQSAKRCQYDMSEVLRYIALSILRDDEFLFLEKVMFWLDTVLRAHHKQAACSKAYQYLQEAIDETLTPASCSLIRPYISIVLNSLQPYS
ncbi:MAG: phycobilisome protein [Cyanobacteria bacterium Co-bin13]|nr:phycobilisome protein [Cyanobacteria bacterium Co-bin13]